MLTEQPSEELMRSLETAERSLTEAEDVLWAAAARGEGDDRTERVAELTEDLWALQHGLRDLRRELDT